MKNGDVTLGQLSDLMKEKKATLVLNASGPHFFALVAGPSFQKQITGDFDEVMNGVVSTLSSPLAG